MQPCNYFIKCYGVTYASFLFHSIPGVSCYKEGLTLLQTDVQHNAVVKSPAAVRTGRRLTVELTSVGRCQELNKHKDKEFE